MSNAGTPILVSMATPVLEILLLLKFGQISLVAKIIKYVYFMQSPEDQY